MKLFGHADLQSTAVWLGQVCLWHFSTELVGVTCQATAEAERWDASQDTEVIEADDETKPGQYS